MGVLISLSPQQCATRAASTGSTRTWAMEKRQEQRHKSQGSYTEHHSWPVMGAWEQRDAVQIERGKEE